jgi:TM2 domain-containing membrane protein YozV
MSGKGSTSNVLAALASLLIAGLGQFIQGRKMMGAIHLVLWAGLWAFMAGWIITIWSVIDAAVYKGS